jgi:hypothetical protein
MPARQALHLIGCSLLVGGLAAADHLPQLDAQGLPLTDCPGSISREPLIANRITTPPEFNKHMDVPSSVGDLTRLVEGRRLLLDSDSYPRHPGRLVGEPSCRRDGDVWHIGFSVDRMDDVVVRAVDESGAVLHTIACGVLGPNAPAPLQAESLQQTIVWDGTDAKGQLIADVAAIEVGVGLAPRFDRFLGHEPSQLSPYLSCLTVDQEGRVYVGLHTHRYDPSLLRFDREGRYLDMAYPSDPQHLYQQGKRWEEIYDLVEYIDGYPVPVKPSLWRAWIEHWDDFVPLPFAIGPDNKGYFIIGMPNAQGTPLSLNAKGDLDRLDVIENLDDFWFWPTAKHVGVYPPMYLQRHDAGFAFESDSRLLVASKSHSGMHGPQPFRDYSGTIRRVDLRTGENIPSFTEGRGNSIDKPSSFLRPNWSQGPKKNQRSYIDKMQNLVIHQGRDLEPDPEFDSPDRLCDIEDLTVDAADNILVIDGFPRRIKCYGSSGAWLGAISGLEMDGQLRRFHDLISIEAIGESIYLLSSFRDDQDGPVYLVKCRGTAPELEVVWSTPLDRLSRFIAVDTHAEPSLVWVGNGNGPASVSRIEDLGAEAGAVRHLGTVDNDTVIDPGTIAVDQERNCYVYDKAREAVLQYDAQGRLQNRLDLVSNTKAHYYAAYRRFPFQHKGYSAYWDGTRYFWQSVFGMVPDQFSDRIWILIDATPNFTGWLDDYADGKPFLEQYAPLVCYTDDLQNPVQELFSPEGLPLERRDLQFAVRDAPRNINGLDAEGRLLCRDGANRRSKDSYGGSVRTLDASGESETLCELFHGGSSMATDSRGNIYTVDGPGWPESDDKWGYRFDYTFPTVGMNHWSLRTAEGDEAYSRGSEIITTEHFYDFREGITKTREAAAHIVRHKAEVAYLVKFGPEGGKRGTESEQWALRGAYLGSVCGGCDTPHNLLACDGADRLILGDVDHSSIKVVDSAGNLITRFGRYGNAETLPGKDGDAKQLGFRNIYGVAASGDHAYISDRDLHRIAIVRMDYRERVRLVP